MAINIEKNEQGWRITSDTSIWILISDEIGWYFYFEHMSGFVDIGNENKPKIFDSEFELLAYIELNDLQLHKEENEEMEEQNGELSIN